MPRRQPAGMRLPLAKRIDLSATRVIAPIGRWLAKPNNLRRLQRLPSTNSRGVNPEVGPWGPLEVRVPQGLAGEPGITRIAEDEQKAFEERPLPNFHRLHHEAMEWSLIQMWRSLLPSMPRFLRAHRQVKATVETAERNKPLAVAGAHPDLDAAFRHHAAEIGLSTVGVAAQDEKYVFAEYQSTVHSEDRVIVAVLEQNWDATQTAPSSRAERSAFAAYAVLMEMSAKLCAHLIEQGYTAHVHASEGEGMAINYAVQAGLGQLGLNGQLLTPIAGSRCRIKLITTNAPLTIDKPVDLGIEKLCDSCKICVRRCPAGAITSVRREHRGVVKAKLNTTRCLPVVAQADGCAICMKVCPVQRFGLQPVLDHWEQTGDVLGAQTDALEGYDWIDGRRYGAGERPKIPLPFFSPEDMKFDAARVLDPTVQTEGGFFADGGKSE